MKSNSDPPNDGFQSYTIVSVDSKLYTKIRKISAINLSEATKQASKLVLDADETLLDIEESK
jgi:hypothetical protein